MSNFERTTNPFTNLRQGGFTDLLGHHLTMCQDFVEAETQHSELLAACELLRAALESPATFYEIDREQFNAAMDAAEAVFARMKGEKANASA